VKVNFCTAVLAFGLVICGAALAQTPPSGGLIQQEIERQQAPRATQPAPTIRIEQDARPETDVVDQQKILVTTLSISGAQVYSDAVLIALTGFGAPRELTLGELRAMAATITRHYRDNGYFVAQAYLPAQDVKDGALTIAVLEGRFGEVNLQNSSGLSDGLANGLLDGVRGGDTVAIAPLERSILLLSDLPGVNVTSTLVPGASVGASDLIVELTPGPRVAGSIDADNHGSRYSGENRLGGALYINNPTGHGDLLSVRALTSDAGLHYGRMAYQAQIGSARAGLAYSHMQYRLGKEFDSLEASGTVGIASVFGSYPLIRSRRQNLTVLVNLDAKTFRDRVDATDTVADKKAQVAMLSLNGDVRDGIGGGGLTAFGATWSAGRLDLQDAGVVVADAATARSNGHYHKLSVHAMRLQGVTDTLSLYAAFNGQVASKNLDNSEKMGLGGPAGVRAYPTGEAYGDQGYILNLEARAQLPKFSDAVPGQMQVIGFVDSGSVMQNKNVWAAGQNRRTLSGFGIGFNWIASSSFVIKATLARKLGSAAATSAPDAGSRFWLQAVRYF
jgi:hemolysin activation/secretion protein